jgi:hypothetical protein
MGDCPVALADDGAILWRGMFKSPEDAAKLAQQFEHVSRNDWFHDLAASYALALRKAIQEQEWSYDELTGSL